MEFSITLVIIIITTLISISAFNNERILNELIFYPPAVQRGQWYRMFSCGLIHADWGHLIFNMLALYLFGNNVETAFNQVLGASGRYLYLLMYILALGACVIPSYTKNKNNYHYRSLGASGGVSAVIFSSILFYPLMGIGLFFIPIYIAGFIFGILYLVISSWLDRKGGGNINHSAHIFGAVFGIAFTIIACRITDFPILQFFISQIQNANPSDFIQFGR